MDPDLDQRGRTLQRLFVYKFSVIFFTNVIKNLDNSKKNNKILLVPVPVPMYLYLGRYNIVLFLTLAFPAQFLHPEQVLFDLFLRFYPSGSETLSSILFVKRDCFSYRI